MRSEKCIGIPLTFHSRRGCRYYGASLVRVNTTFFQFWGGNAKWEQGPGKSDSSPQCKRKNHAPKITILSRFFSREICVRDKFSDV